LLINHQAFLFYVKGIHGKMLGYLGHFNNYFIK